MSLKKESRFLECISLDLAARAFTYNLFVSLASTNGHLPQSVNLANVYSLVYKFVFNQLDTSVDISGKREFQLKNCLHQFVLWECLWRHFLD